MFYMVCRDQRRGLTLVKFMDTETKNKNEVEPALIHTSDLQPSPPPKAVSVHSSRQDNEKKYDTIRTIKMTDIRSPNDGKPMDKSAKVLASSLNLLPVAETQHHPNILRGFSVNTKLGIIQLFLCKRKTELIDSSL